MKVIDLCCGIGGFATALAPECTPVFACDIDPICRDVYEANFGLKPAGDIFDVVVSDIPDADILTCGAPCQPYSTAGLRRGSKDSRCRVFTKIMDIVEAKQPAIVLLENVVNLKKIEDGSIFTGIKEAFEGMGYHVQHHVLNTRDFGLAQNRSRLYIVATKTAKDLKIEPTAKQVNLKDVVDLSLRDYLDNDKFTLFNSYQVKTSTSGLRFCGYNNTTQIRRGIKKDKLMHSRSHQVTSRAYHVGGAAPTLTTSGNVIIYDGRGFRYLTIEELYTIQGFPPTFKRCGNITQSKHQIGNSVSPKVVRAIALSLL